MGLQFECTRGLHEGLRVPLLLYGTETMILREKEKYRIRVVQMDNLRSLVGTGRMDGVSNARIRVLCKVAKGVGESINESVLCWFGHIERMENDRIAKRVHVG